MSIKNLLLRFQDSEYDMYLELQKLCEKTGNTVSKEIRIAIKNHIEAFRPVKYKQGWLGFWGKRRKNDE